MQVLGLRSLQVRRGSSRSGEIVSTCCVFSASPQYYHEESNHTSIPRSIDGQLAHFREQMFCKAFLESPDEYGRFPTGGDRVSAQELKKRMGPGLTSTGFLCQLLAVVGHNKSPEQLKQIADSVGRDRIQIIHGTEDKLITVPHADVLAKGLRSDEQAVKKIILRGKCHALPVEQVDEVNDAIAALIEKTQGMT